MPKKTLADFSLELLKDLIKSKNNKLRRSTLWTCFKKDQANRLSSSGLLYVPKGKACISGIAYGSWNFVKCLDVRVIKTNRYGMEETVGTNENFSPIHVDPRNHKHSEIIEDHLCHWILTGEVDHMQFTLDINMVKWKERARHHGMEISEYVDKMQEGLVDYSNLKLYALRLDGDTYRCTYMGKHYAYPRKIIHEECTDVITSSYKYRGQNTIIDAVKCAVIGRDKTIQQESDYRRKVQEEIDYTNRIRTQALIHREERDREYEHQRRINEMANW